MNRRNHVEEVVDDSEPEREEIRRRERLQRRSKRKRNLEIIELTDSEKEQSTPPQNQARMERDNKALKYQPPLWVSGDDDDMHVSSAQASPVAISVPPVATLSLSKDSENEEDELDMDIARFAYKNVSRPSTARDGPSRGITFDTASTGNPALNKKFIRRQRPIMDIPDTMVARLMTCVSCNLKWTARKTVKEKMKHVQLCAKRNLLTDETVTVLIRQEIDKAPTTVKGKEMGQPELPKEPNTVLEDVLNDHAPKKRRKRPEILKTVKSLAETRNIILDRARTILGDMEDDDFTIQTQKFGPSNLVKSLPRSEVVDLFPLTQPFRKSALGRDQTIIELMTSTNNRAGDVSGSDHCNEIDNDAPPTQEFAPSKLGGYLKTSSGPGLDGVDDPPLTPAVLTRPSVANTQSSSTISLVECFAPPITPVIDIASPHARKRSPHQHPRMNRDGPQSLLHDHSVHVPDLIPEGSVACSRGPGTPIAIYDEFSEDNDDDDAYLHFDPSAEIHNQRQPTMLQNDLIPSDAHLTYLSPTTSHMAPHTREYSEESATNKAIISKKKITGKGKQRKGDYDELHEALDDSWESKMKDMIIEDNFLYQRILRYEPIHFDVFFRLAVEQGPSLPPRGLRIKLRSLLDKLTVNFYGADPVGRRY